MAKALEILIAALVLTASCQTKAEEPNPPRPGTKASSTLKSLDESVADALNHVYRTAEDPTALISDLHLARRKATKTERAVFDLLIETARRAKEASPKETLDATHKILEAWAAIAPDRFDLQMRVEATFAMTVVIAENLGLDPEPIRKEARRRAERLARRFPREGRVYAHLANPIFESSELDALRLMKRCAELDPESYCSAHYRELAIRYRVPLCETGDVMPNLTLWIDRPVLSARDFAEIRQDENGAISIQLTTRGSHALARASKDLSGPNTWAELRRGDRTIHKAKLPAPITNGRLQIMGGGNGLRLSVVCARTKTRTIPRDARP